MLIKGIKSDKMKSYKGVSPLIASVLLIAFTMAIAAILTAWISSFTTAQKEKTAVFEEKIQCSYGFIENDLDFSQYNSTSGLFKARIKNTGSTDLSIGKYQVWYDDVAVPSMWELTSPTTDAPIKKQDAKTIIVNVTDSNGYGRGTSNLMNKIKFIGYICDGITTIVTKPLSGWAAGIPNGVTVIPSTVIVQ